MDARRIAHRSLLLFCALEICRACGAQEVRYEFPVSVVRAVLADDHIVVSAGGGHGIRTVNMRTNEMVQLRREGCAWDMLVLGDKMVALLGAGKRRIVSVSYRLKDWQMADSFEVNLPHEIAPSPRIIDERTFYYRTGDTFVVHETFSNRVCSRVDANGFEIVSGFSSPAKERGAWALASSRYNTTKWRLVRAVDGRLEQSTIAIDSLLSSLFGLPGFTIAGHHASAYITRFIRDTTTVFRMRIERKEPTLEVIRAFPGRKWVCDAQADRVLLRSDSALIVDSLP